MTPPPTSPGAAGSGHDRGPSRWSWLLPVGTFLAGCALGGVVAGVGVGVGVADRNSAGPAAASPTAAADPEQDAEQGGGDVGRDGDDAQDGLTVRVPESCLQAADGALTMVERVDRVVAAVRDVDPRRLQETVDDVQEVRTSVQRLAEQCSSVSGERLQDAAPTSPAPSS